MAKQARALLIDLDGVLYQEDGLIPGALETMRWIEQAHIDYLFVTNTTSRSRQSLLDKFASMGLQTSIERIITPIVAASAWLDQNSIHKASLFVSNNARADFSGIVNDDMGRDSAVDAVVIGDLGAGWDYATLNRAFRLLMQTPPPVLIALGMTRYWQSNDGLCLDVAPFVKALEHAADCTATVIGKPSKAFYDSALSILGYDADQVVMIGDDIIGDVKGAQDAGLKGLLVKTGKFRQRDLASCIKPDAVLESFADLPDWWRKRS